MASLFCRAFGYNRDYLLFGEGPLKSDTIVHDIVAIPAPSAEKDDSVTSLILASLLDIAEGILRVIDDKDAINAWVSIVNGNFESYQSSMKELSSKHGGRTVSPILAKFVSSQIAGKMYLPITSKNDE